MNNISTKKIRELFDKSFVGTFNDKTKVLDTVDATEMYVVFSAKEIKDFYFSVGLRFIHEFLSEINKK